MKESLPRLKQEARRWIVCFLQRLSCVMPCLTEIFSCPRLKPVAPIADLRSPFALLHESCLLRISILDLPKRVCFREAQRLVHHGRRSWVDGLGLSGEQIG